MMSMQKGFTLIELMIVVAIIAILAAIAISQYTDYVIRAQVSEGAALADGMKSAYVEYVNIHGVSPPRNSSAGLAAPASITGSYVSSVDVTGGPIVVTYSNVAPQKANAKINTATLTFSPVTHAGSVNWVCKSISLKSRWCSASCNCSGP